MDNKDSEAVKQLNKQIRKQRKLDRRAAIHLTIRDDLDIRDKWLRLRRLRHEFTPIPYSRQENGKH
eukprot:6183788-Prorocentrum_lima.AAC.1